MSRRKNKNKRRKNQPVQNPSVQEAPVQDVSVQHEPVQHAAETVKPAKMRHFFANLRRHWRVVTTVLSAIGLIIGFGENVRQVITDFSDPLRVTVTAPIIGPFIHLIVPYPPGPGQRPTPMWISFRTTITSTRGNMWMSGYSVFAKTKYGWVKLVQPHVPPGKDRLFMGLGVGAAASFLPLKPESEFDYNIRGARVGPDTHVTGWMFSETVMTDPITMLRFEFLDQDGKTHTREVRTVSGSFASDAKQGPPDNTYNNLDPLGFEFDPGQGPTMTPDLANYLKEMQGLIRLQGTGIFSQMDELPKEGRQKRLRLIIGWVSLVFLVLSLGVAFTKWRLGRGRLAPGDQ